MSFDLRTRRSDIDETYGDLCTVGSTIALGKNNQWSGGEHESNLENFASGAAGNGSSSRQHGLIDRPGWPAGHHHADRVRTIRSEYAGLQPAAGPEKVLAFAQDNEREFMQGVDHGLAKAAADRGLEYRRATANNDAAKMVEQVQLFLASRSARWSPRRSIRRP